MIPVSFVHFYRPNGRQELETIEMRDEVGPKVAELTACGCRLTAEVLHTGHCSFCIEEPDLGDYAQILTVNGAALVEPLHEMILAFSAPAFEAWKREQLEHQD